ncbi:MAG: orotidine-5'-phosphate decarboxylase [Candidatus Woykebacteria bacterium]
MEFKEKLDKTVKRNDSLLCIGLDPEISKFPKSIQTKKDPIFQFNKAIVGATAPLVCVYKPNIAFYEAYGLEGLEQLKKTIEFLQKNYPQIPVILDAKRGDIGNTAKMYAKALFEYWNADAATVYPHLGLDSLKPFFEYKNKLTILLLKTSNPDSKMFQDMKVGNEPYYLKIAKKIKSWKYANFGLFVGATYPAELKKVRSLFPNRVFLTAGLGAQKGEVRDAVLAGLDKEKKGIMFNASRSILYASQDVDFAKKASEEAKKLRDLINQYRYP